MTNESGRKYQLVCGKIYQNPPRGNNIVERNDIMLNKLNDRDGIFKLLFNNKENFLQLYGALSGIEYPADMPVKFINLNRADMVEVRDDVFAVIDNKLVVVSEEKYGAENFMMSKLMYYIMGSYKKILKEHCFSDEEISLFSKPEVYSFYSGNKEVPNEFKHALEHSCGKEDKDKSVLIMNTYNLNYDSGSEILQKCQILKDYSRFLNKVKQLREPSKTLYDAVCTAVHECIEEDCLSEFLSRYMFHIFDIAVESDVF